MTLTRYKSILLESKNITIAFWVMVMFILLSACSDNRKHFAKAVTDRDSLPSLDTKGITTLISDSGVVQYKVTAEEWKIFDRTQPPYWAFEKGVHLQKFDSAMKVEANVRCDTAYYYTSQDLWKLIGKVSIINTNGEKFFSHILYWDKGNNSVYSDEHIEIHQPDKIIYGQGFNADQRFIDWTIRQIEGIIYVDKEKLEQDSIASDTLAAKKQ